MWKHIIIIIKRPLAAFLLVDRHIGATERRRNMETNRVASSFKRVQLTSKNVQVPLGHNLRKPSTETNKAEAGEEDRKSPGGGPWR